MASFQIRKRNFCLKVDDIASAIRSITKDGPAFESVRDLLRGKIQGLQIAAEILGNADLERYAAKILREVSE